jgi:phosphoesterase RecJ-like protein
LDEKIAHCLLTGMISETHSFKTQTVTPSTLNIAGKLMNLGANRDTIVKHLYRTRSISALKLWGEALSHLQIDKNIGLAWTTLTREDFARSGAEETDLQGIIAELIGNSPEAKIIINEPKNHDNKRIIHGLLSVDKQFDALELLRSFNPQGNKKTATFVIEHKTLKEVEEMAIETIKKSVKT